MRQSRERLARAKVLWAMVERNRIPAVWHRRCWGKMPNQVEIDHIVPVAQPSYFQPLSKDTASLNGMSVIGIVNDPATGSTR
jgi:hypothetical protein